jgi:hypothetical protein
MEQLIMFQYNINQQTGGTKTIGISSGTSIDVFWWLQINRSIIWQTLSNKIELYANREVDFLKDVILRNDADSNGDYIAEWNLDIP